MDKEEKTAIGEILACRLVIAKDVEERIEMCELIAERSERVNLRKGSPRCANRLVSTKLNKLTADEIKQLRIQVGAPILYSGGAYLGGHTHGKLLSFSGFYCRDFFLCQRRFTYYAKISKDVIMAMWWSASKMGDIEDGGTRHVTLFRICGVDSLLEVL